MKSSDYLRVLYKPVLKLSLKCVRLHFYISKFTVVIRERIFVDLGSVAPQVWETELDCFGNGSFNRRPEVHWLQH